MAELLSLDDWIIENWLDIKQTVNKKGIIIYILVCIIITYKTLKTAINFNNGTYSFLIILIGSVFLFICFLLFPAVCFNYEKVNIDDNLRKKYIYQYLEYKKRYYKELNDEAKRLKLVKKEINN